MGGQAMGKQRKQGGINAIDGKLYIRFWWHHPDQGANAEHRWAVNTRQADTESNRIALQERLNIINTRIQANAFYPCQEFPDHKIASYCRCPACASVTPMSRAHVAPLLLSELLIQFEQYEKARSSGNNRIVERSTWDTKRKGLNQLKIGFTWLNPEDNTLYQLDPLADYAIRELDPESTKFWLTAFQHRQERLKESKPPNTSGYIRELHSYICQALEYGRLKGYWKDHPLLNYQGTLIQPSKEERNRAMNMSLFKPFSLNERDRILEWLRDYWIKCPEKAYGGREKLRRFFLYHYCVIDFNTGLRSPSEMTALFWPNINYHQREIRVCQSRESSGRIDQQIIRPYTKTIKHRGVPINDMAMESFRALEEYRQDDHDDIFWNPRADAKNPFLIKNGWAPLTGEKRIRYTFNQCMEELDIKSERNQGQYRMRHTFVTLMLDHTKFSDAKVAELIGDTVETMQKHYKGFCINRWRNEDDASQMNAMNQVGKGKLHAIK